jgi:hypothetical protein
MGSLTHGFADNIRRLTHFGDHAADFGAATDLEYEQMADAFLGGPPPSGAYECTRIQGDLVRYNPVTNELGVISITKVIHTYFKPKFCKDSTPEQIARKKCHKNPTHLEYVKKICHQTF